MAEQSGGVTDNAAEGRYEMGVGGKTAVVGYNRKDGILYLTHTEVPEELEGQGIGSKLVKHVLDKARSDGEKVAPWCPFVRAYIDRHPEYEDLVAQGE